MALLQNSKAIFYHPLDDSTESLKSQAWTVGSGSFAAAKITSGLFGDAGDSASFGTQSDFTTNTANDLEMVALSSTKIVAFWIEVGLASGSGAKVGTVSGSDITYGAETIFEAASLSGASLAAAALDSTHVVVAWEDTSGGTNGRAKVGTISGTDITFGAEYTWNGDTDGHDVAALSSTKFVIAFQDASVGNEGMAIVGTVSGTAITFGTKTEYQSGSAFFHRVTALDSTKVVVAWRVVDPDGRAKVGTVSGADITFGAESTFLSGQGPEHLDIEAMSSTVVVVVYRNQSSGDDGEAKVGTVSGTDITWGASKLFDGGNASTPVAAKLTSTKFVISWRKNSTSDGASVVGTVSGTDITLGADSAYLTTAGAQNQSVAALSSSDFVVGYLDPNDNNGAANVGQLLASADATASTPAAYDPAAAATKVAFGAWLKNPSA